MILGLLSPLYHFPSRAGARVSIDSSLYLHGFKTGSSGQRAAPFLVTMAATINVISLGKMTPNLRDTVGGDIFRYNLLPQYTPILSNTSLTYKK